MSLFQICTSGVSVTKQVCVDAMSEELLEPECDWEVAIYLDRRAFVCGLTVLFVDDSVFDVPRLRALLTVGENRATNRCVLVWSTIQALLACTHIHLHKHRTHKYRMCTCLGTCARVCARVLVRTFTYAALDSLYILSTCEKSGGMNRFCLGVSSQQR
jgi:hypothetical protein